MKDPTRRRKTQRLRWGAGLAIFVAINVILRLALMGINQAEYTDGIIQITQFKNPDLLGIYPPLYPAMNWLLSFLTGPLWAGRLVSTLFSAFAVIPLYLLALRSFGMRAAVFAALVYTVAPVALRWSPRVMTDATFSFFFWFACERLIAAQGAKNEKGANWALAGASIFGVLASLTRYQGMLLAPPVLFLAFWKWKTKRHATWKGSLFILLYALVPLWDVFAGSIHGTQFLERTEALGAWMTFILTAEPFFLSVPYFLTYPVFLLGLLGIYVGKARRRYGMTWLVVYVFLVLLVAQSLFASFQERYFLPFYGLMYILAGLGLAVVDDRCRRKFPRMRPYMPLLVVVWSLFISTLVLVGSRQAFGDLREASEFAGRTLREQGTGRLYANEIYRRERPGQPRIAALKASFFSGQDVEYLEQQFLTGQRRLDEGDIVMISSRSDPGGELVRMLSQTHNLELLTHEDQDGSEREFFISILTPVFPDLMENRSLEQSPMAWLYRYQPQTFYTRVYRVASNQGGP